MFYEYAVDPELVLEFESDYFWKEAFINQNGRFISWSRSSWMKSFYNHIKENNLGPIKAQKYKLLCQRLIERAMIDRSMKTNSNNSWCENAIAEHARHPFHAILPLKSQPIPGMPLLKLSEVYDTDLEQLPPDDPRKRWLKADSIRIERTAGEIVGCIKTLLHHSNKLIICDPFLDMSKRYYKKCFELIFKEISRSSRNPKYRVIELHSADSNKLGAKSWEETLNLHLPPMIPSKYTVRNVLWKPKYLHNRYILTNEGGAMYGEGFREATEDGRTKDTVTRIKPFDCLDLMKDHDSTLNSGEVVGECIISVS